MATQGFNSPGTATTTTWSNPNNALTVNGSSASNTAPNTATLRLTNYAFTVPAGVIDGIEAEVTASQNSGLPETDYNLTVSFTKDGSVGAGSSTDLGLSGLPLQTLTVGGASSLHGTTWTVAEVNASTFGVIVAINALAGTNACIVDCVRIKIYYTATGGGSGVVFGMVRRPAINVRVN